MTTQRSYHASSEVAAYQYSSRSHFTPRAHSAFEGKNKSLAPPTINYQNANPNRRCYCVPGSTVEPIVVEQLGALRTQITVLAFFHGIRAQYICKLTRRTPVTALIFHPYALTPSHLFINPQQRPYLPSERRQESAHYCCRTNRLK